MTVSTVSVSAETSLAVSTSTVYLVPTVATATEATPLESVKYEIGALILSRMRRLLVICDMHGDDLREVSLAPGQPEVPDGRAVMRAAITADMGELSHFIDIRLGQMWLTSGSSGGSASPLGDLRSEMGKLLKNYKRSLLRACDMHVGDLREILGPAIRLGNTAPVSGKIIKTLDPGDGRAVMREVLLTLFNRMNRDVARRLDAQWH